MSIDPLDFLGIDRLLTDEERMIRDTVGSSSATASCRASRSGSRRASSRVEIATELGELGLLGMHLEGYGCAGHQRGQLRTGVPGARGGRQRLPQLRVGPGLACDVPDLTRTAPTNRRRSGSRGWRRARRSGASD